jgi:hypothetical protein
VFKDIGRNTSEAFWNGVGTSLGLLEKPLGVVATGMERVGSALGNGLDAFVLLTQDPKFLRDFGLLWDSIAVVINGLSIGVAYLFSALTSFFAVLSPYAERFSDAIRSSLQDFNAWIQSAEGQQTLKDWFDKAWQAGTTLWNIVVTLTQAFSTLFTGSQEEGQSLLDKILELATRFKTWIEEVTADGRLQQWLRDAKQVGTDLYETAKLIGQTFKDLNTEENKQFLRDIITLMKGAIIVIGFLVSATTSMVAQMKRDLAPLILLWQTLERLVKSVRDIAQGAVDLAKRARDAAVPSGRGFDFNPFNGPFGFPFTASGGLFNTASARIVGEAGPEAVIPLDRPLHMVDPSVRAMSALLQGKAQLAGAPARSGATINVYPIQSDPEAVAMSVMNRLAVAAL